MTFLDKFYSDVKKITIPILSPEYTADFPRVYASLFVDRFEGFKESKIVFDNKYWKINNYKLYSATTIFKRYIQYTEIEKRKSFLGFKYKTTEYLSDLEEIEEMLENIKYDIKFKSNLYVEYKHLSYFLVDENDEFVELDKKGYLEIIRRIHKIKISHFKNKTLNKINKILTNAK